MTMVERVARALLDAYHKSLPSPERFAHLTWEDCPDVHKSYLILARAAIEIYERRGYPEI